MDVLKPQSKEKMPAIVYVTGGGFINANKDSYMQQRMDLAEQGYVVASIEYRVAPTNGVAKFDVGENLNESSDVQAAVDLYGLSDLTQVGADYSAEVQAKHMSPGATEALWVNGSGVFGGKDGGIMADLETVKAANPMTYISSKTPPFLFFHGSKDTSVSPSQTELVHQALLAKGMPSTRYVVTNAPHGGYYWVQPAVMDKIIEFFNSTLK